MCAYILLDSVQTCSFILLLLHRVSLVSQQITLASSNFSFVSCLRHNLGCDEKETQEHRLFLRFTVH